MKKTINHLLRCSIIFIVLFISIVQVTAQTPNRGNTLSFDGTNDFITINSGTGIVPTSGNYTIALWAQHDVSQSGVYFEIFSQSANLYFGGTPSGSIRLGDNWTNTAANFPTDGAWHHYAIVREGNNGNLFIDGVLMAVNNGSFYAPYASTTILGAQYDGTSEYFKGQLDDISVWNRALTNAEISSLSTTELSGSETNLLAYYNCNQGTAGGNNSGISNLTDKKGLYNGVFNNFAKTGTTSNFIASTVPTNQNALDFDGSNDYVNMAAGVGLVPTSGDYSLAIWARHKSLQTGVFYEILSQGNNLYLGGSSTGIIRVGDGWGNTTVPFPTDAAWHHYCVVRSGTTGYLYIDGALLATKTAFPSPPAATFVLGNQYGGIIEYFNGQTDELSVWNRALSNAEIKTIMNSELSGTESGLLSYYNFNQGINAGDNSIISHLVDKKGSKPGTLTNIAKTGSSSNFVGSGFVPGNMVLKLSSFSPVQGNIGATVTITGTGFSTTPANNTVYIGAVKATVSAATSTSLTVSVPAGGGSIVPVSVQVGTRIAHSEVSATPYFYYINNPTLTQNYALSNFSLGYDVPWSVAVGDINADGNSDIITGCTSYIRYSLGDGTGGIQGNTSYYVGSVSGNPATSVIIGDFNGDGKKDVASNAGTNNVAINYGNGTGSFSTASNYSVGTNCLAISSGDFNQDGIEDIVTANAGSNNVSVLLGYSAGGFAPVANFAVGSYPNTVVVADFNADGKADIACSNNSSANVSILLGNGMGGFAAAANFAVGSQPMGMSIADFNADGKPDLAVANFNAYNIGIYLGNGTGGFVLSNSYSLSIRPSSVSVGDFDGDGNADFSVPLTSSNQVKVFLGNGTGSFTDSGTFSVGSGPQAANACDFNKDGKADMVSPNTLSNNISVLLHLLPPPVAGTAASNSPVCYGAGAAISLSGFTGTIQWQESADGATNWTNISGATEASYSTLSLYSTVYYRAVVSQTSYSDVYSNVIQITILPTTIWNNQSTAGQSKPLNSAFSPITVSVTDAISYQWYQNTTQSNSGGISLGTANGAQTNTYTPQSNIIGTSYYYCVIQACPQEIKSAVSGAFFVYNCQPPLFSSAFNVTATSADIDCFNPNDDLWHIIYNAGAFNPATSGTFVDAANQYIINLSNLLPNTLYTYYIRFDCGYGSGVSNWAGPYTFTTSQVICNTITSPWTESFESAVFPPICWTNTTVTGTQNWLSANTCSGYGIGTAALEANFWNQNSSQSYDLVTYAIDNSSLTQPLLKYDYAYAPYNDNTPGYLYQDKLQVYASTDNGTTWTLLLTKTGGEFGDMVTTALSQVAFTPIATDWATQSIVLPAATNRIKFRGISDFGNNLYLDNIRVLNNFGGTATSNSPVCIGNPALLSLSAYAGNIQWQQSANGISNWANVTGGTGANSPDYTTDNLNATIYFRARVENANDSCFSNVIVVTTIPEVIINSQSTAGQTTPFNGTFLPVSVSTTNASAYQWYTSSNAATVGGISLGSANGAQTDTYTPQADNLGTLYYYCVVQGCQLTLTSDISGAFIVNCPLPSSLSASNITGNSADLSWYDNGATLFNIKYALGSFNPQLAGTLVSAIPNHYVLTGLSQASAYNYYVQTNCGADSSSQWIGPYAFSTICGVSNLPWTEDFESQLLPPTCWSSIITWGSYNWQLATNCSSYGIGSTSIIANFFVQDDGENYSLITFPFDISAMANPKVKFDFAYAAYPGLPDDKLNIYYSTNFGANWILLLPMTGGPTGTLVTGGVTTSPFIPNASQWATQSLILPVGTNKIKFEAISGMGNNLYLDNIRVVDDVVVSKTLNLKLYLEGLYGNGGIMNQSQNETGPQFPSGVADQVDVELHNNSTPYGIFYEQSNVDLHTDGTLQLNNLPANTTGSYYIAIRHRNSIETWSALPYDFSGSGPFIYDFSTAASQAYGNNQKQFGAVYAIWGGDATQDGIVDGSDMSVIDNASAPPALHGYYPEDINGDGVVDGSDMTIIDNNSAAPAARVLKP